MSRLLLPVLLLLGACTAEVTTESNAAESAPVAAPSMPADAQVMQVGCYGCVFGAEDAQGCQLAAMIDDKPVLVEGVSVAMHPLGLCTDAKEAQVAGEMSGDVFIATAVSVR